MGKEVTTNWLMLVEANTDEELTTVYLNKGDYVPEYVAATVGELEKRGYRLDELVSEDAALWATIKQKSDEELLEIFTQMDEYTEQKRELVLKEIKNRNLYTEQLQKKMEHYQSELYKGIEGSHIVAGYVFCVLGGIIGLAIALQYLNATIKTADGELIYKYNESTRQAGKGMLIVFAIVVVLLVIVNVL
jgi:hypothetical protein